MGMIKLDRILAEVGRVSGVICLSGVFRGVELFMLLWRVGP